MRSTVPHFYLQANSPGEITAWVGPVVGAIRHQCPTAHIIVCVAPCQYASGREVAVAEAMEGVDEVWPVAKTVRSALWFFKRERGREGAVIFLGGDPLVARLLGFRFGLPVFGYSAGGHSLGFGFKKVFSRASVGDLMADRVVAALANSNPVSSGEPLALFFAGSRPQHFAAMAPFMVELIRWIRAKDPVFRARIQVSDFIDDALARSVLADVSDIEIGRGDSLSALQSAALVVSLPGTNTAEAGYLRVPTLVLMPTNRPQLVIFDGFFGLIGSVPGFGWALKRVAIAIMSRQKRFYALPNRFHQQSLVPELVGHLTLEWVGETILDLMKHPEKRADISKRLEMLKSDGRTAERMVGEILKTIQ